MLLNIILILSHCSSIAFSWSCKDDEKEEAKKLAKNCFNSHLTNLARETTCENIMGLNWKCNKEIIKCFGLDFATKMSDFYLEKAIQLAQWLFLAEKLLHRSHAKSVFYFFSPFLVQFCSDSKSKLSWSDIFYEECLHLQQVLEMWPLDQIELRRCPSVIEYLTSGRPRKSGPIMSCSDKSNQEHNFCVQQFMNILPARKNSSWKDACRTLKKVTWIQSTLL